MRIRGKSVIIWLLASIALIAVLTLGMLYPFLPGEHDRLAFPVSILIQAFGAVGLLLVIPAVCWLLMPNSRKILSRVIFVLSGFILFILAFVAKMTAGFLFCVIILGAGIAMAYLLKIFLRRNPDSKILEYRLIFSFLIILPTSIFVLQLTLATPISTQSRMRAMKNAEEFIRDIESYYLQHGYYPGSLQALHKDYSPGVAGIEKYNYHFFENSYNLSFEQPRFLFDVIGTREWVVFNPAGNHKAYSHTAWLLLLRGDQLHASGGWYHSGQTTRKNWKYFLFD